MIPLEVHKASNYANIVKLLLSYSNIKDDLIKLTLSDNPQLTLTLPNGTQYTELPTIMIYIMGQNDTGKILYPDDNLLKAKIDQWISLANKKDYSICDSESIREIDSSLVHTTFLVCNNITLADIVIYSSLLHWAKKSTTKEKELMCNLSRWYNHIQHLPGISIGNYIDIPTGTTVSSLSSMLNNVNVCGDNKKSNKSAQKAEGKYNKKIQNSNFSNDARPVDDITRLAVRVGLVKEISKHPDADKIYCLKIDIAESKLRDICSGLVEHLKPEEIINKKVCVLSNLKPRKIRGVDSNGMVLCVSYNDKVELLEPPSDSMVGELITWGDLKGEPDVVLSGKSGKNPFEAVQKDLVCKNKIGYYKDLPFSTLSGVCSCNTLIKGTIS
ncbi:glutamyl-Q tRNA(Asp) synthetase [Babesia microti strain RI]|uniref:Glutamyl-Q tRNA(Asp) synthetase n=1 Tax=Babesia microti (strain RI) TaxID=1133968 RepID=A0A1N6LX06_BABMR|nr:glutamyl-Q tRNA(Asp) synthetase [Babesia microti strain RI]SIO73404.1 glutamyl-Q tRNA(Asp) synthetase [Babesia microti strain RI]|eukprot:XP_021337505.1 glutamyl-Q tRNA(Asp) synthetase [Babesia microti strain RI]